MNKVVRGLSNRKTRLGIVTLLLIVAGTNVQGQNINTYAGDATANYLGDGGPATAAGLNQSTGVAIDTAGNIYIADSQNYAVRKVDAKTGLITTVAGNGTNANSVLMDGIQATASELSDPWGVAVDDSGNIYIADYGDKAIRKVTASTGIISTIAGNGTWAYSGDGGPATAAELSVCIGVALDDSANVYIADQWNHCIRKITKKTGIINTIAGIPLNSGYSGNGGPATNAHLAYPSGIVVDDSGNVYIADQWNNEIRVVSQKTGIINDFAGTGAGAPGLGSGAYTGDGGPATAAQLNYATGVGKDDSGNIYIADWDNQVIRKVTLKTGIITTVAGDNALGAGYSGDGGAATAARLNNPSGVVTDACGNIYIADYANNRVRKVTLVSAAIKVSFNPSICNGVNDTLSASGAGTYHWSPSIGLSDTTGSMVIANPTATTTYIITGTGICSGAATPDTIVVTVTAVAQLTVTQQPLLPTCSGQSVTLSINGGGSNFTWSPSTGLSAISGSSVTATPSATTTYTVTGTNSGGCSSSGTYIDTIIPAPSFTVLPIDTSFCSGQSAILHVDSGGSNFLWTPVNGITDSTLSGGDSVVVSPTVTTTYTVIGNNPSGCATSGTDVVTIIASPGTPTFTQIGDTLTSSSVHDNQWYRNDTLLKNDTSQHLIINTPGEYYVVVTNEVNGCSTSSDSMQIKTGINQLSVISNQLSIYPNPFNNNVFIKINSAVQDVKNWNLQITDVLGRTIYSKQSLDYSNDIDLPNLASGVYFMTVISKTGRIVVPVVKQ